MEEEEIQAHYLWLCGRALPIWVGGRRRRRREGEHRLYTTHTPHTAFYSGGLLHCLPTHQWETEEEAPHTHLYCHTYTLPHIHTYLTHHTHTVVCSAVKAYTL